MEENPKQLDPLGTAKKFIYNQKFSEAIELLEQVIAKDANNIEAYNLMAYAVKNELENTTDGYNRSLQIMQTALEIQPSSTLTLFNIASTCYEMQEYNQSISYYNQLISGNKVNDYRAYFNLAMCYEKLGDNHQALEQYQHSIRLNPNFSSAVINYSNLLMQMGKQTQAKYTLENYLKNNKGDLRALNNLNIILAEKQIDQKVEENFKKINQSGAITSVYNNGVFLSKQGKLQEALQIFKGLVERLQNELDEPLLLLSHVNQGVLYEKMNDFELAIQKYHYILENFGDQVNNDEFYQRIGELQHREKEGKKIFPPRIPQQPLSKTANQWRDHNPNQKLPAAAKNNNFMRSSPQRPQNSLAPIKQKEEPYQIKKPSTQEGAKKQGNQIRRPSARQISNQQSLQSEKISSNQHFDEHTSSIEQISMVQNVDTESRYQKQGSHKVEEKRTAFNESPTKADPSAETGIKMQQSQKTTNQKQMRISQETQLPKQAFTPILQNQKFAQQKLQSEAVQAPQQQFQQQPAQQQKPVASKQTNSSNQPSFSFQQNQSNRASQETQQKQLEYQLTSSEVERLPNPLVDDELAQQNQSATFKPTVKANLVETQTMDQSEINQSTQNPQPTTKGQVLRKMSSKGEKRILVSQITKLDQNQSQVPQPEELELKKEASAAPHQKLNPRAETQIGGEKSQPQAMENQQERQVNQIAKSSDGHQSSSQEKQSAEPVHSLQASITLETQQQQNLTKAPIDDASQIDQESQNHANSGANPRKDDRQVENQNEVNNQSQGRSSSTLQNVLDQPQEKEKNLESNNQTSDSQPVALRAIEKGSQESLQSKKLEQPYDEDRRDSQVEKPTIQQGQESAVKIEKPTGKKDANQDQQQDLKVESSIKAREQIEHENGQILQDTENIRQNSKTDQNEVPVSEPSQQAKQGREPEKQTSSSSQQQLQPHQPQELIQKAKQGEDGKSSQSSKAKGTNDKSKEQQVALIDKEQQSSRSKLGQDQKVEQKTSEDFQQTLPRPPQEVQNMQSAEITSKPSKDPQPNQMQPSEVNKQKSQKEIKQTQSKNQSEPSHINQVEYKVEQQIEQSNTDKTKVSPQEDKLGSNTLQNQESKTNLSNGQTANIGQALMPQDAHEQAQIKKDVSDQQLSGQQQKTAEIQAPVQDSKGVKQQEDSQADKSSNEVNQKNSQIEATELKKGTPSGTSLASNSDKQKKVEKQVQPEILINQKPSVEQFENQQKSMESLRSQQQPQDHLSKGSEKQIKGTERPQQFQAKKLSENPAKGGSRPGSQYQSQDLKNQQHQENEQRSQDIGKVETTDSKQANERTEVEGPAKSTQDSQKQAPEIEVQRTVEKINEKQQQLEIQKSDKQKDSKRQQEDDEFNKQQPETQIQAQQEKSSCPKQPSQDQFRSENDQEALQQPTKSEKQNGTKLQDNIKQQSQKSIKSQDVEKQDPKQKTQGETTSNFKPKVDEQTQLERQASQSSRRQDKPEEKSDSEEQKRSSIPKDKPCTPKQKPNPENKQIQLKDQSASQNSQEPSLPSQPANKAEDDKKVEVLPQTANKQQSETKGGQQGKESVIHRSDSSLSKNPKSQEQQAPNSQREVSSMKISGSVLVDEPQNQAVQRGNQESSEPQQELVPNSEPSLIEAKIQGAHENRERQEMQLNSNQQQTTIQGEHSKFQEIPTQNQAPPVSRVQDGNQENQTPRVQQGEQQAAQQQMQIENRSQQENSNRQADSSNSQVESQSSKRIQTESRPPSQKKIQETVQKDQKVQPSKQGEQSAHEQVQHSNQPSDSGRQQSQKQIKSVENKNKHDLAKDKNDGKQAQTQEQNRSDPERNPQLSRESISQQESNRNPSSHKEGPKDSSVKKVQSSSSRPQLKLNTQLDTLDEKDQAQVMQELSMQPKIPEIKSEQKDIAEVAKKGPQESSSQNNNDQPGSMDNQKLLNAQVQSDMAKQRSEKSIEQNQSYRSQQSGNLAEQKHEQQQENQQIQIQNEQEKQSNQAQQQELKQEKIQEKRSDEHLSQSQKLIKDDSRMLQQDSHQPTSEEKPQDIQQGNLLSENAQILNQNQQTNLGQDAVEKADPPEVKVPTKVDLSADMQIEPKNQTEVNKSIHESEKAQSVPDQQLSERNEIEPDIDQQQVADEVKENQPKPTESQVIDAGSQNQSQHPFTEQSADRDRIIRQDASKDAANQLEDQPKEEDQTEVQIKNQDHTQAQAQAQAKDQVQDQDQGSLEQKDEEGPAQQQPVEILQNSSQQEIGVPKKEADHQVEELNDAVRKNGSEGELRDEQHRSKHLSEAAAENSPSSKGQIGNQEGVDELETVRQQQQSANHTSSEKDPINRAIQNPDGPGQQSQGASSQKIATKTSIMNGRPYSAKKLQQQKRDSQTSIKQMQLENQVEIDEKDQENPRAGADTEKIQQSEKLEAENTENFETGNKEALVHEDRAQVQEDNQALENAENQDNQEETTPKVEVANQDQEEGADNQAQGEEKQDEAQNENDEESDEQPQYSIFNQPKQLDNQYKIVILDNPISETSKVDGMRSSQQLLDDSRVVVSNEQQVQDEQTRPQELAQMREDENRSKNDQIVEEQNAGGNEAENVRQFVEGQPADTDKVEEQAKNNQQDEDKQSKAGSEKQQETVAVQGSPKRTVQTLDQLEQDVNAQEQLNESNAPVEILQIPSSRPRQQQAAQGSEESSPQSNLRRGDTNNFADPKKQVAKIIKYPDDFEDWTQEQCEQLLTADESDIFAHYKLAIISISKNDDEKAKQHLHKVAEIDPHFEVEKVHWALGRYEEEEKNWHKALHHFRTAYPYTNERFKYLMDIARCYAKLLDFEKTERTYKKAIELNNKDPLPFYKLGWFQIKNKILKPGIDNLAKAQTLDDKNLDIIIKLGEAYMLYEEDPSLIEEAIAVLLKGVTIDPLSYDCTSTLARAYEKKGDLVEAIHYAKIATQLPSTNPNSIYYLGTLYMKKKELRMAAESFRSLLKLNSEHVEALIEYGTISSIQGNFKKAIQYLKHALKQQPNNPVANMRLGRIYQTKLKDFNLAIEAYTKVHRSDDKNYKAYYYMGLCYIEKKDFNRATECMKEALRINPKYGMAWKKVGNLLYERDQPAKALKYFQKALDNDPSDLEAKIGLGNCFYLQENFDQAIQIYSEISNFDVNDELEYNLANCYYMKGQYEEAIVHYQRSLRANPKKTESYYNMGNTYCIQERYQEAIECFQKTLQLDPGHSAACYNNANTFYVLKDYDTAARYFEKAIELQPENVDWKNYVANMYMEKQDYVQAKRHLDEAYKLNAKHPETLVRNATYFYQTGNYRDAIKFAKNALALDENNEEAKALIKDLTKQ